MGKKVKTKNPQTKNPMDMCAKVCPFVPYTLKGQKDTILDVSA